VVINGLQLHVPSASLAAVISLALSRGLSVPPAGKTVLKLSEPAKIFARGRKFVLSQELLHRKKFAVFDAGSAMNARLQFFDEPFRVPLMLFGRHFPRNLSATRCDDNCAFEGTGARAKLLSTSSHGPKRSIHSRKNSSNEGSVIFAPWKC
jgi:hypothetical protein